MGTSVSPWVWVTRAVINDLGKGRFNLVVEGTNLQAGAYTRSHFSST